MKLYDRDGGWSDLAFFFTATVGTATKGDAPTDAISPKSVWRTSSSVS